MQLATQIAGYLILFTVVGFGFVLFNLAIGALLRPRSPNAEKVEIYECGEPSIGSSFVQYDSRFYVVALLFIIFEVEVAFFFPWGVVFGKANQAAQFSGPIFQQSEVGEFYLHPAIDGLSTELGLNLEPAGDMTLENSQEMSTRYRSAFSRMVWTCVCDILIFFAILMLGFAYVWKRGDLDWVRSTAGQMATPEKSGT